MKLFLDTSILLAACGSSSGASRAVFDYAPMQRWELLTCPWVIAETIRNLPKLGAVATSEWSRLRPRLKIVDDVTAIHQALVFPISKDKPVLLSAFASANVLLTLDREDFTGLLGSHFYGLPLFAPADFLMRERAAGRL